MTVKVDDDMAFGELVRRAAHALAYKGLEHRIDIYRTVEIDDKLIRESLGRDHRVRVRVKITAESLLFEGGGNEV
jgi:hypothetical protein